MIHILRVGYSFASKLVPFMFPVICANKIIILIVSILLNSVSDNMFVGSVGSYNIEVFVFVW